MLHIKRINIHHDAGIQTLSVGGGLGFPTKVRKAVTSIEIELLCDNDKETEVFMSAMNGGTLALVGPEMLEKIEDATEAARTAVEELNLEKQYIEKKIEELQALTKRLLEDR